VRGQDNESKENPGYEGTTVKMASRLRSDVNRSNKTSSFTVQKTSIGLKWKEIFNI